MLIHKWSSGELIKWGINCSFNKTSMIEMTIKIPLPFIKIERWFDFESLSTQFGKRLLCCHTYFRIRKNYENHQWEWYEKVIFDINLGWFIIWRTATDNTV